MKTPRTVILILMFTFPIIYNAQTWNDTDPRVKAVNGWGYMIEYFQFFKPIDITKTSTDINLTEKTQEFSVAGWSIKTGAQWNGQGNWVKNTPENIPNPDFVTIETKYVNATPSVKKIELFLQLQSSSWAIGYGQKNNIPLDGSLTKFTWDVRESKEKLSTGIIRIYLSIKNITSDSSYSASTICLKNLKFIYADGSEKIVDFDFTGTNVQNEPTIPSKFELSQNYPNPFNPTTSIKFSVPQTQYVSLKVYDALGKEVATLVDEEKSAGNYNVQFNGNTLASGVYLYRLQAGSFVQTKKLMLMK